MRKKQITGILILLGLIPFVWWVMTPIKFVNTPKSAVVYDSNGKLIDALVATDGQWRLPMSDTFAIPEKYKTCLLHFEDKRFYQHRGVDWMSMIRASIQNVKAKSVVSGGSTISMQLIRITRPAGDRNMSRKITEMFLAQKLEVQKSKEDILRLYAANAPYGGNVVGLQAASQRYFGREPEDLTWAESALLAVLPNAPSSIHLNKNRIMLKAKRDRLLRRLYDDQLLNDWEYELAIEEEIPDELRAFPHEATHLLMRLRQEHPKQSLFETHVEVETQKMATEILEQHAKTLRKNGIHNSACIIADTRTGAVKAYVGNTGLFSDEGQDAFVDIATAKRSTGSILKPFLYAHMLSKAELLPNTLVKDVPSRFGNFSPQNFNLGYDGAVPASQVIVRSLNVPSVNMLQVHGVPVFLDDLHQMGIQSINQHANHYGLSLILGGAEARLDELCAAYASMGRRLSHYTESNAMYYSSDFHDLQFLIHDSVKQTVPMSEARLTAAGIWFAFEAMKELQRPSELGNWEYFSSSQPIAWKTGTSYGFRDAWAIGVTPDYTIAVWVGNAEGDGRPGLIGLKTAAPIMFDLFNRLPALTKWFDCPWDDMIQMPVCEKSGYLASAFCDDADTTWIPASAYYSPQCPYHQRVHLDETGEYRVNLSCYPEEKMQHENAFVLPPAMEWYYRQKNPWYHGAPAMHPDCSSSSGNTMEILYPDDQMRIYLPVDLNGKRQALVFEAAHQNPDAMLYWHVDDEFVATTKMHHQLAYRPETGKHLLSIVDQDGNKIVHRFEILDHRN